MITRQLTANEHSLFQSHLTVIGNIYYGAGLIYNSDMRLKQNIEVTEKADLDEFYKLNWKQYELIAKPGQREIGLIAQEVVKETSREFSSRYVFPRPDGFLGVSYDALNRLGLVAIQDINKRLNAIEERLSA